MASERDLYARLGVSKTASEAEIRSAYRKLARQYHPDMNPGDKKAEERFKDVSAAYDVLSDAKKRPLYDEFGDMGLREGFDAQKARAYQRQAHSGYAGAGGEGNPFGGFDFGGGGGAGGFDLRDLFNNMRGGPGAARPRRGRDVMAAVEIDLVQALRGAEVRFQKGGTADSPQADTVTVRIPPGADQGSRLRVPGHGEPGMAGGPPGDLVLETVIRPHPYFRRDGRDLTLRFPVTIDEAYNGATVEVPTPTGKVSLRIPEHSQQGTRLRLRGKGVTRGKQTGDLYVELEVRLPDTDDAKFAEAARAAREAYAQPLRDDIRL